MPVTTTTTPFTGTTPFGEEDFYSVYVYDSANSQWETMDPVTDVSVNKIINGVWDFSFLAEDVDSTVKNYFIEGARVAIYYHDIKLLIGRLDKPSFQTNNIATVTGKATSAILLEKQFLKVMSSANSSSTISRQQFDGVSVDTIVDEILSINGDGSSPWTMQKGSSATSYGSISVRAENVSKLEALSRLGEIIDYEWYVDTTDSSNLTDKFFLVESMGSDKSGSVTISLEGSNANIDVSNKEIDRDSLANEVKVIGYGDGEFQKSVTFFAASDVFTTLDGDINDTTTTINLTDASSFPASGRVIIGEEVISYTGKSGNQLTGVSRGANDSDGNATTARSHPDNVLVFEYYDGSDFYTPDSPKTDSSIEQYELRTLTINRHEVTDYDTLQLIASHYLNTFKQPPTRIVLSASDADQVIKDVSLGDTITVTDGESDISGSQRIVGINYEFSYTSVGVSLQLANVASMIGGELQKVSRTTRSRSLFMQGAPSFFDVAETDNLENPTTSDTANPQPAALDLEFDIPNDTIEINRINLSYKTQKPKIWSESTDTDPTSTESSDPSGAHTHKIDTNETTAEDGGGTNEVLGSGSNSSESLTANTWKDLISVTPSNNWTIGLGWVNINRALSSLTQIDVRILRGSTTYPNSGGFTIDISSGGFNSCQVLCMNPNNDSSETVKLQIRAGGTDTVIADYGMQLAGTHNHDVEGVTTDNQLAHTHTVDIPSHSHTAAYELASKNYGASDIKIYTTDDASVASPTWTERTSAIETGLGRALASGEGGNESDLDLTDYFTGTGRKGIRIIANGDSRIKAQVNGKVFIESR